MGHLLPIVRRELNSPLVTNPTKELLLLILVHLCPLTSFCNNELAVTVQKNLGLMVNATFTPILMKQESKM